ncbi:hypothetical protein [Enterovirga sp.]|uniref:hypothetical protein n=1 Tax=Enterovirga sp. TaxID=2026350 RepID=UPI002C3CF93A|nr:hypothetical protein [Enterovirga sp.]HMO29928.1 hypothetical protein [Enterovirga sp.]
MAGTKSYVVQPADEFGNLAEELRHVTGAEADAARIASGRPSEDATEATEEEVPAENIAHISDASLPTREEQAAAFERRAKDAARKNK